MHSYLSDRYQEVHVGSKKSARFKMEVGVPQGSVIGNLLFLMYINDVPEVISHCDHHIFADDLQIYKKIPKTNFLESVQLINSDVNSILKWSIDNYLNLNESKTQAIIIKNTRSRVINIPQISVGNNKISYSKVVKNLGLYIDEILSWANHLNQLSKKINFI